MNLRRTLSAARYWAEHSAKVLLAEHEEESVQLAQALLGVTPSRVVPFEGMDAVVQCHTPGRKLEGWRHGAGRTCAFTLNVQVLAERDKAQHEASLAAWKQLGSVIAAGEASQVRPGKGPP